MSAALAAPLIILSTRNTWTWVVVQRTITASTQTTKGPRSSAGSPGGPAASTADLYVKAASAEELRRRDLFGRALTRAGVL